MTWIRVDDAFAEHPKIVGLSDAAFRLWWRGMCYSARWNRDGVVPAGALPMPKKLLRELVERATWHEQGHTCESCPPIEPGEHYIHDFLVYNPRADEVEEKASKRSERARKAALARWRKDAQSNAPSIDQALPEGCSGDAPEMPRSPTPSELADLSTHGGRDPSIDDERFADDPVELKVHQVLDRCADAKMRTASPQNPAAYRAKVIGDLAHAEGARLRKLIADHDASTPVEMFAGELLGEPNHLADYRTKTTE